jgi:hypothetical protein
MIQFLVFAVEKFASSPTNRVKMQKGVSSAFTMSIKLGVVPSVESLQSFPMLDSSAPELKGELHRIFPEHFPSATPPVAPVNKTTSNPIYSEVSSPKPKVSLSPNYSFSSISPNDQTSGSVIATPSPLRSPKIGESTLYNSPGLVGSPVSSPVGNSPLHLNSSVSSVIASSDTSALSTSSFLPDNLSSSDQGLSEVADETLSSASVLGKQLLASTMQGTLAIPIPLLVLGEPLLNQLQESIPAPCGVASELFLETLNDVVVSWSRQPNAVNLGLFLGEFLHKLLEQSIINSYFRWPNEEIAASHSFVLDVVFDHVLKEKKDIYIPFLQAMHSRDATVGFRLLAYCSQSKAYKFFEESIDPYAAFIDSIGGSLATRILDDFEVADHIDSCRFQGSMVLCGSSLKRMERDEFTAKEITCLAILPWILQNRNNPSITTVISQQITLIQFLARYSSPRILPDVMSQLVTGEYSIFSNETSSILESSLKWESWQQYLLWDFFLAEAQSSNPSKNIKMSMGVIIKLLLNLSPMKNPEAISGLMKCMLQVTPDASMLQAMFKLPPLHGKFPLTVLSCWIDKFPEVVKNYVLIILQTANQPTKDVIEILQKLEELLCQRRSWASIPLLYDETMIGVLRKLFDQSAEENRTRSEFPLLFSTITDLGKEPPTKRQRVEET